MHEPNFCRTIGLTLLPSELLQGIFIRLSVPEIPIVRLVSKALTSAVTSEYFLREYNTRSVTDSWVFVYKKRYSLRDSVLLAFTDRSNRWFSIPLYFILHAVVTPGDALYFLTAAGNFFLFASNRRKELIVVNLSLKTAKKIPPCMLGPRDTGSWRRSGFKLVTGPPGSNSFRFIVAEYYENRPVVFEYSSGNDKWRLIESNEIMPGGDRRENIYLCVSHHGIESVILAVGVQPDDAQPVILRPRIHNVRAVERESLAIGFTAGSYLVKQLHIFGDGLVMIIRLDNSIFMGIELWGLSLDGGNWELISPVPNDLVEKVKKPYSVMTGILEERDGVVRIILMSNYEGLWETIGLSYDFKLKVWSLVLLPKFRNIGSNIAGIAISSGLTLS